MHLFPLRMKTPAAMNWPTATARIVMAYRTVYSPVRLPDLTESARIASITCRRVSKSGVR